MIYPIAKQLSALPTYNGSKRKLLSWIGKTLSKALPPSEWTDTVFIDLFMGSGAVSMFAKAQGFKTVIANDVSVRSRIIADALLKNKTHKLTPEEALLLIQPLPPEQIPGFIEQNYCPSVFSTRHAQALDLGFHNAQDLRDVSTQALAQLVMWHLATDFVSFSTSLGTSNRPFAEALDGLRGWDELNPKRFTDGSLKRLLQPTWSALESTRKRVNGGVFGGSPVEFYQQDAIDLLSQINGDVLYMDPPYAGTVSYERANSVLDAILTGHIPETSIPVSKFSQNTDVLNDLFEQARHIPIWLLSYGNQQLNLDELVNLIKAHAGNRRVEGFAKAYRHLPHVSKNDANEELLVIAYS